MFACRHDRIIFIFNIAAKGLALLRCIGIERINEGDKTVRFPAHGRDNNSHLIAIFSLCRDERGHMADAFQISDRCAAEFHDDAGQLPPPVFKFLTTQKTMAA